MSRSTAVTVCVVTGDDRRATRQFLARLAGSLGPHDNVVLTGVKTPPPSERSAWRVPSGGELRPVTGGTTPRPRPVVVFVDDRAELADSWLELLVGTLDDPLVAAVAPRTNVADGDELLVGIPYRPDEAGLRRSFARDLAESKHGHITLVDVLAGPCIAARRDALDAAGGLDDVLREGFVPVGIASIARRAGGSLAVAEGCYLHHPGGAPRWPDPREDGLPLVTACLIVRDEEANLPSCLDSMRGLADEVVVYDTGSVDGTVALAEHAGATVVRGYWDDDFSRARNDALAACRGQWILWLDADETLVCDDPAATRATLRDLGSEVEGFVVLIDNLKGNEAASVFTHSAGRLFRRAYGHWEGHLHELVVARTGRPDMSRLQCEMFRIAHRGYLQSHIASRAKGERNLRTAFGDLAGGSDLPWSIRLLSLGRSYVVAGRIPEGLDHCRQAAEIAEAPTTRRLALRTSTECLLALGRPDAALEEIALLRAISSNQVMADAYEGRARLALGEYEAAIAAFDKVHRTVDEDGWEHTPDDVAASRAEALGALGRHGEAADALLACLRDGTGLDAHLGRVVESLELAGRDISEIFEALGRDRVEAFLPQLLQLQPHVADLVLESWHLSATDSREVLATASIVARKLEISRQLVWSSRLRASGFAHACPLVVSAADGQTPPRDRVLAAAVAVAMFGDARARQAFGAAVMSLPAGDRDEVASEVAALSPQLSAVFEALVPSGSEGAVTRAVQAGATRVLLVDRARSSLRSAALAAELARLGHETTLLQPLPVVDSAELLGPLDVTVRGWQDLVPEQSSWQGSCESALAWATAEAGFDVVVTSRNATAMLPALRRLLPRASVVVDLDDGDRLDPDVGPVDLLLSSSRAETSGTAPVVRVARVEATSTDLFAPRRPAPLSARTGLCLAGDLRCASDATGDLLAGTIAPLIASACAEVSIALCGDDPVGVLTKALPGAIAVGATADPSPWLGSCRVVLVTHADGAGHWLALAASLGTPVLVVPPEPERAAELAAAVAALLVDDDLWQRFVPVSAPAGRRAAGDPFAELAARSRSTRRGAPAPASSRPEVRFVGGVYGLDSLSQVNRELVACLARTCPDYDVTVVTHEVEPFPRDSVRALTDVQVLPAPPRYPAAVEVRHQWPPDFTPVSAGRLVCIQPWEFGGLPAEWIAPLRDVVDDLWVPTSWVRECAIRSGVATEKVHVVPNGVDVMRFRPDGPTHPLRTRKATKLLFVGGLIERKGVDALLEAYLSTFTASDDVCLVVKPFGSSSVYSNATLEREVCQAAAGGGAEIEIVDGDLSFDEMAALYRSCDALVHPYRGEGFGLPIAEAMASGLPVVVTNGGACLDFCDEENAWLVGAREVPIRPGGWTPSAPGTWWLEPSRREISAAIRAVREDPDTAKRKGAEARQRIVESFTWEAAVVAVVERIEALLAEPVDVVDGAARAREEGR